MRLNTVAEEITERMAGIETVTQKWVARQLGISPQYFGEILNGRRNLSMRVALALDDVFGTSPGYFARIDFEYRLAAALVAKRRVS